MYQRLNNLRVRKRLQALWYGIQLLSVALVVGTLLILLLTLVNQTFGSIAVEYQRDPETLTDGQEITSLANEDLAWLVHEYAPGGLRVVIRDNLSSVENNVFTQTSLSEALRGNTLPAHVMNLTINEATPEDWVSIVSLNLSSNQLQSLVWEKVVGRTIVESWVLWDAVFNFNTIQQQVAQEYPNAQLTRYHSWINSTFLNNPMSSEPIEAGIFTAIQGSLWVILLTAIFSLGLGIPAGIYLEELAPRNTGVIGTINLVLEMNIRILAGVPSIIYGLLGLSIFVRLLSFLTSGQVFGVSAENGRTILSASLTLALLILPIIIVNTREAIRTVPDRYRLASKALGASKVQTTRSVVIPSAIPGIMTGTILGISRAFGETAPLVVVGASTFILTSPEGPFSKFTVLPIQIFNWTSRPQHEFTHLAGAGGLVLIALIVTINLAAIVVRNRTARSQ